jgi:hypothetical protein
MKKSAPDPAFRAVVPRVHDTGHSPTRDVRSSPCRPQLLASLTNDDAQLMRRLCLEPPECEWEWDDSRFCRASSSAVPCAECFPFRCILKLTEPVRGLLLLTSSSSPPNPSLLQCEHPLLDTTPQVTSFQTWLQLQTATPMATPRSARLFDTAYTRRP